MFKGLTQLLLLMLLLLSACAHRGATRVDCTGPLRAINPGPAANAPVSTEPAPSATTAPSATQP